MNASPDPKRMTAEEIALAMLAGEASPAEAARLDEIIRSDPSAAAEVIKLVGQEAWLCWSRTSVDAPASGATPLPQAIRANGADETRVTGGVNLGRAWMGAAAVLLLLIGGATGAYLVKTFQSPAVGPNRAPPELAAYSGRILNATACRWSPDFNNEFIRGEAMRQGESLNLLEGVAKVELAWSSGAADLEIEGPAGVVLTAAGGCSVSHGRLTASVRAADDGFTLDTPNCQVSALRRASVGVLVDGRDVEVHVFDGGATVVVPWASGQLDSQHFQLRRGEALALSGESEGNLLITRVPSSPASFLSQTSMQADRLEISDAYVQHVKSLSPLLYWRFDDASTGAVENAAGAAFGGVVHGRINRRRDGDNQYVDMGAGISPEELTAYIVSSDPIERDLSDGYALEMWVKPSHYHLGVLAGLVTARDPGDDVARHGMMLELGGPRTTQPWRERPGKVRFLHRSPPGLDPTTGVSCFSSDTYALRRWQHVVAVKDEREVRLYLNGRLSDSAPDDTQLDPDLRLLVGQIDQVRQDRQFVGQLDELALYAHPLSEEDIRRHFELARRPEPVTPPPNQPGI